MNPLAVAGLPVAVTLWVNRGIGHPAWLERWVAPLRDARVWATLVVVFTVGRNLPWVPFVGWAPS